MDRELRADIVTSMQVINESIDDAISDNRDFVTMDMTDAIDVNHVFKKVMIAYGQNGINK